MQLLSAFDAKRRRLYKQVVLVISMASLFLTVAYFNRLPILFPDTIGYSSIGEAVFSVLSKGDHPRRRRPETTDTADTASIENKKVSRELLPTGARQTLTTASDSDGGMSEARSPYYGVVLAFLDRIGGVWLSAIVQSVIAATALLLALPRLGLTGKAAAAAVFASSVGGLAFYACVLIPDIFLSLAILALAFLITGQALSRRERMTWMMILLSSLLFHRSFLAVAVLVVACAAVTWRGRVLSRSGWRIAAVLCGIALAAHAAVAPVASAIYGSHMTSQPFVLARMIEGRVVPAYLNDVCPAKPFLLCKFRNRLPMDHDRFLWSLSSEGVFNTMSSSDKQRLDSESNTIVLAAIRSRPIAAFEEAIDYSAREFFFVGMNDFSQRVPLQWRIDPPLAPAIASYFKSGIVVGDFPLQGFTDVTQITYGFSLAALVAAGIVLARPEWARRRRTGPINHRVIAAITVILVAVAINAVVCGTLSGIRDRYTGRVAWLASLAAISAVCQTLGATDWMRHPAQKRRK